MGVRKEKQPREKRRQVYWPRELNNRPTSPRKMRLVADLVRGQKVEDILRFSSKEASKKIREIGFICYCQLASKNPEANMEEAGLFKTITVDGGMMLKRLPVPQGRAHRIRKRRNQRNNRA
jgi:large subunit ribosomal protein L22